MGEPPGDPQGEDGPAGSGASPDTWAATAGRRPEWTMGVVNPPVFRASTIIFPDIAAMDAARGQMDELLFYGRKGTPTTWALREALTALEPGAAGTLLFPSGVAALASAILAFARPGGHLLLPDSAYEPTADLAFGLLADLGLTAEVYDPLEGAAIAARLRPETCLVLLESPGSLSFEVQDVPAIAAAARAAGVPTLLDNSWSASVFFKGIAAGCDMVMQSLSKYVSGHSDLMMGSVSATPAAFARLRRTAWALGQCVSGDEAALALRGLRTLPVRLRHQQASALKVAHFLDQHPRVARVRHPALPGCPGHEFWRRDFTGASGLFGFEIEGEVDRALFCDPLHHFRLGYSWGGFESLIIPAQARRRLAPLAPGRSLFRLSIGLEDTDELIADLSAALDRIG